MLDPREGLTPDGMIRTGVRRERVPAALEPVLADLLDEFDGLRSPAAELHLYGSVATGQARVGASDLDVVLIDGSADWAAAIGEQLSQKHSRLCRGVEIGPARRSDYQGDQDEAYGNRVFLRHYCLPLAGPNAIVETGPFPGDRRAARGFNGDIGRRLQQWRSGGARARAVGRKTLLAAAGVMSVRNRIWTTDRETAARAWAESDPGRRGDIEQLSGWANGSPARPDELAAAIEPHGIVTGLIDRFADEIGFWNSIEASRTENVRNPS